MEVRVGDVVRLKPVKVSNVYYDGSFDFEGANESREGLGVIPSAFVEEFILRIETDAEKIARLEARVKELEAQQKPEVLLYPDQLTGYGPWIDGPPPLHLVAGTFRTLEKVTRLGTTFIRHSGMGGYSPERCQKHIAYCLELPY
jgi:hypothetical protein